MTQGRETARELLRRSGWIVRVGALAAVLAAVGTRLLPGTWESTAVLLPPERRADDFRYADAGAVSGLARSLLPTAEDETEPLAVWEAVLGSAETARRLVERFDLTGHFRERTTEAAVRRLQECVSFEAMPYGPFEIRVRTNDPALSADLANALAMMLEERLRELYREDAGGEREFLEQASRESAREEERSAAHLAAVRVGAGVADEAAQGREAESLAAHLAYEIAAARTALALAERRHGGGSVEAADASARLRELERAAHEIPALLPEPGLRAAEDDLAELQRAARFLAGLRVRAVEHQAAHDLGVRILDRAVPAERAERRFTAPVLLAALLVPAGAGLAVGLRRSPAWSAREGLAGAALAAGAALVFAREPLVLVALLGVGFVVTLARDLRAAWLALVIALPWAWDYLNERAGFEIQFPTEPGIILLAGAWVYSLLLHPKKLERSPMVVAMLLAIAWMAVTATTSVYLRHSLFQLVSVSGFILVGALFPLFEIRRLEEIERVIVVYVVSGAVLSVYGIVQVISSPVPLGRAAFFIGEPFLYNHGPYTAFLGFALGPALVYLITGKRNMDAIPLFVALMLMTIATIISFARAAWVTTALLLVLLLVIRGRLFLRRIAVPLALTGLLVVAVFLRSPAASQSLEHYWNVSTSPEYASNVERINRWVAAGRMFLDRPLTGVGPGAYEMAYDEYRDVDFSRGRRGTHSELLRVASEQGLPGVLILTFLVVAFWRTGIRLCRAPDPKVRRLAAAICAGMFTYVVQGTFNEFWRVPKIALTMWVFAGLLGALDRLARGAKATPSAGG
ncbi:MAG: O-antigen ligase family protein [Candidatus Eiseniibacteriota bacterium]